MGAAYWDDRFTLVRPDELDDLEITVDLIGEPVVAVLPPSWDPATVGVQLRHGDHVLATLLPGLEHIATADQQLRLARRKAGLAAPGGGPDEGDGGGPQYEGLTIDCFTTRRWPSATPMPIRPDPRALAMATWDLTEEDPC
jgi:hypothetical protein